jgi:serine protease Do
MKNLFTQIGLALLLAWIVPAFAEGDGFDPEKLSEIIRDSAMKNNGKLEMSLQAVRNMLGQAGMPKAEMESMSGQELLKFFSRNLGDSRHVEMGRGMNMMKFSEEDLNLLDKQFNDLLKGHRPAIKSAAKSTVGFFNGKKKVSLALGAIVDARGIAISKASELKKAGENLTCLIGKTRVKAKIVKEWKDHDLALVQIEQSEGLTPIIWYTEALPATGAFLAAPGINTDDPIAIGLLSVSPRSLSHKNKGFLGIGVGIAEDGIKVSQIFPGTPAARSGIKVDDVIIKINGKAAGSVQEFIEKVSGFHPGDVVKFDVQREEETLSMEVELMERPADTGHRGHRFDKMNTMGTKVSDVRIGFPNAFQNDLAITPNQAGGPVVDLRGNVLGINIARAGRIKTYSLPSAEILKLLKDVDFEEFVSTKGETNPTPPAVVKGDDSHDETIAKVRSEVNAALKAVAEARKALNKAEKASRAASKALEAIEN